MSTTRESKPWCAITSAEKLDGIDSHPLTTTPPFAQIVFTVFSRTSELLPGVGPDGPRVGPAPGRAPAGCQRLEIPPPAPEEYRREPVARATRPRASRIG